MTPTYFFEQYFQWWQSAATRYLNLYQNPFFVQGLGTYMERYLEIKKLADRMMEETWRNLRLPTLDDMTRLHERLNLLESKLVALQEENQTEEIMTHAENLKSLDQSFGNRRKGGTQSRKSGARVK